MMIPDSFYVTLPSNSSLAHFPNNTPTNYTVQLSKTINFNGDYEVALVEIKFSRSWHNIVDVDDGRIAVMDHTTKIVTEIRLHPGLYYSGEILAEAINNEFSEYFGRHGKVASRQDDYREIKLKIGKRNEELVFEEQHLDLTEQEWQEKKKLVFYSEILLNESEKKLKDAIAVHNDNENHRIQNLKTLDADIELHTKKKQTPSIIETLKKIRGIRLDKVAANEKERANEELIIQGMTKKQSQAAEKLVDAKKEYSEKKTNAEKIKESTSAIRDEISLLKRQLERRAILNLNTENGTWVEYQSVSHKFEFNIPAQSSLEFSVPLVRMLGLVDRTVENKTLRVRRFFSHLPINLISDVTTLYVYVDCIDHQFVGDKLVPLLREVHLADDPGIIITKTYNEPFYRPVNRDSIRTIEIDIRDGLARSIHYSGGDVVVTTLHFRRRLP